LVVNEKAQTRNYPLINRPNSIGLPVIWFTCLLLLTFVGCNSIDGGTQTATPYEFASDLENQVTRNADSLRQGRQIFWVGGCASCHGMPGSTEMDHPVLGGGLALNTPYGVFTVPNISPDQATGIGGWSEMDFANAMLRGVSPAGEHYFPAFPYASYAKMTHQDIRNLWSYLQTLPPVANEVAERDLRFPFNGRNVARLWNQLFFKPKKGIPLTEASAEIARGQYLVEGPGHCAECHTPRGVFGGFNYARWLSGGPALDGEGVVPNITPHETGLAGWSIDDIVYSLTPGMTHAEAGSFGEGMESVRRNIAMLPKQDQRAIAAYLMALPPVATRQ